MVETHQTGVVHEVPIDELGTADSTADLAIMVGRT